MISLCAWGDRVTSSVQWRAWMGLVVVTDHVRLDQNEKPKATSKSKSSSANETIPAVDLASIHLDGEEDEEVEIYDTCDDIRRKINQHLKKVPKASQASLARELDELLPTSSLNSQQLSRFLKFKGPKAGGHSIAFYAGYVYFEKLRIKNGGKKTKKREEMENSWEMEGGFPRVGSHNLHFICSAGKRPRIDQYGKIQMVG